MYRYPHKKLPLARILMAFLYSLLKLMGLLPASPALSLKCAWPGEGLFGACFREQKRDC